MAEVSSIKCYFFNIGYCKKRDKGCKHIHPEERCVLSKCANKYCLKRHQRPCRYKSNCNFLKTQTFEYIHKENTRFDNCDNDLAAKNEEFINKINLLENIIKAKNDTMKEFK